MPSLDGTRKITMNKDEIKVLRKAANEIEKLQDFIHVARMNFYAVLDGDDDPIDNIKSFVAKAEEFEYHRHPRKEKVNDQ